jgi:hypothetical protein
MQSNLKFVQKWLRVFLCNDQADRFFFVVGEETNTPVVLFLGLDEPRWVAFSPSIPNGLAINHAQRGSVTIESRWAGFARFQEGRQFLLCQKRCSASTKFICQKPDLLFIIHGVRLILSGIFKGVSCEFLKRSLALTKGFIQFLAGGRIGLALLLKLDRVCLAPNLLAPTLAVDSESFIGGCARGLEGKSKNPQVITSVQQQEAEYLSR